MRIVIAEDAALFRAGLARLVQDEGHQICAAVADGDAMLAAAARYQPDIVIADIRMPPTYTDEGLRAALELRRTHPGIAVLVLSQYIETRYVASLLHDSPAGVGYLLKDRVADVSEFTDAVTRVAAGGTALDREVVSQLLTASRHAGDLDPLTPRERDVLAPDGRGTVQRRHRNRPRPHPRDGRETRRQHLRQAGPAGLRERQPAGAGGPGYLGS